MNKALFVFFISAVLLIANCSRTIEPSSLNISESTNETAKIDSQPPVMTNTYPADGGFAYTNAVVKIFFSEPVKNIYYATNGVQFNPAVDFSNSSVKWEDEQSTLIISNLMLSINTAYTCKVSGFIDIYGNEMSNYSFSFTAIDADFEPPQIVSNYPANDGRKIPYNTNIVIYFNEPITNTNTANVSTSPEIPDMGFYWSSDGTVLTITGTLSNFTTYFVYASNYIDTNGNVNPNTYSFYFTTGTMEHNPSFELGLDWWNTNTGAPSTSVVSLTSNIAYSGSTSLFFSNMYSSYRTYAESDLIPCSGNTTYELSFWYLISNNGGSYTNRIRGRIEYFDSSTNPLATNSLTSIKIVGDMTSWAKYSETDTSPAGASFMKIWIQGFDYNPPLHDSANYIDLVVLTNQ